MPDTARTGWVLGTATVGMGLLAGLFYGYACSVMPGLGRADDRAFVDAMQQINEAIENPVFFATFLGAPALVLGALVSERRSGSGSHEVLRWIAAALVLTAVTLLVTFAVNIPLNDDLMNAGDPGQVADLARVRNDFEGPWVAWNIVRTLAVTGSFCCLARALVLHARQSPR
jgi:uncharacterized membrane protein